MRLWREGMVFSDWIVPLSVTPNRLVELGLLPAREAAKNCLADGLPALPTTNDKDPQRCQRDYCVLYGNSFANLHQSALLLPSAYLEGCGCQCRLKRSSWMLVVSFRDMFTPPVSVRLQLPH